MLLLPEDVTVENSIGKSCGGNSPSRSPSLKYGGVVAVKGDASGEKLEACDAVGDSEGNNEAVAVSVGKSVGNVAEPAGDDVAELDANPVTASVEDGQ